MPLRERLALEILVDDVRRAIGQHVVVLDLDDVGMVELRRDVGFALEPREDLVAAEVGVQRLDRDLLALQPRVAREIDRAHAAAPDHAPR